MRSALSRTWVHLRRRAGSSWLRKSTPIESYPRKNRSLQTLTGCWVSLSRRLNSSINCSRSLLAASGSTNLLFIWSNKGKHGIYGKAEWIAKIRRFRLMSLVLPIRENFTRASYLVGVNLLQADVSREYDPDSRNWRES